MKNLVVLLGMLFFLVFVAACGGESSSPTPTAEVTKTDACEKKTKLDCEGGICTLACDDRERE